MIQDQTAKRTDSSVTGFGKQAPGKGSVLFVLPESPWPLRRSGVSLRFAPIIEYLARRQPVDVLVLATQDEPISREGPLRLCRATYFLPIGQIVPSSLLRKMKTFLLGLVPWGIPFGASPHVARRTIQTELLRQIQSANYSSVVWGAGFLDIAYRVRRKMPQIRFVVDFIDSPALAVSRARFNVRFMRLFRRYTVWKWRRLERKLHHISDASIYISPVDATAARSGCKRRIHVIPNGISTPQAPVAKVSRSADQPVIGFLGDMSYPPNVSAALRLAHPILPRVRREHRNAQLLIIGRNPVPEICRLQGDAVIVTGEVHDVWEFISRVTVFAFPMMEGSGLQNKLLEAMYAGVPVISTSLAAEGLEAIHASHLLIADTNEQIVSDLVRLISDQAFAARLSEQAANFVSQRFSWSSILPKYEAVILGTF